MKPAFLFLSFALVAGAAFGPAALAVTATQQNAIDIRAKAEAAARAKMLADSKAAAARIARAQSEAAARAKARAIGSLAVHNETKRRLEATRAAAVLHARVLAQSQGTAASTTVSGPKPVLGKVHRPLHHTAVASGQPKPGPKPGAVAK